MFNHLSIASSNSCFTRRSKIKKEMRNVEFSQPPYTVASVSSERYQNIRILVSKLFTIFTRVISGSYAVSWLECRQTNMFDAKTVIFYWISNTVVTKFTVQQFLCEIHVDPLMVTDKCNEGCMCNTLYRHKWSTMGREPLEWTQMAIGWHHWACLVDMLHMHP